MSRPISAREWASEMARLREHRPRPLARLYGKRGPTPEQAEKHRADLRAWDRAYRRASKLHKEAMAAEVAAGLEPAK